MQPERVTWEELAAIALDMRARAAEAGIAPPVAYRDLELEGVGRLRLQFSAYTMPGTGRPVRHLSFGLRNARGEATGVLPRATVDRIAALFFQEDERYRLLRTPTYPTVNQFLSFGPAGGGEPVDTGAAVRFLERELGIKE